MTSRCIKADVHQAFLRLNIDHSIIANHTIVIGGSLAAIKTQIIMMIGASNSYL